MNNAIDMFKRFIGTGGTPKEFVQRELWQKNNPLLNNLVQLAQKGDTQSVQNFARNVLKEQGRDFDKEFSEFMNNFKK